MSIRLAFETHIQDLNEAKEEIQELAEQRNFQAFPDEQGISVMFCPLGIMEIQFEQEDGPQWKMEGECITTPAGPGLHKAAADFVETLADRLDLELVFEDEAEYMVYHDYKKMLEDHFYAWLEMLTEIPVHQLEEEEYTSLCLCWDLNNYMPREIPGTVITHMGRFSMRQLAEMLEDEAVEAFAEDFFIWKNPLKDALYHRNCALNELWEQCYFVPSSRSELDRQTNSFIFSHLEQSLMMDRSLPFPIEAYYKLNQLDGRDPLDLTGVPELKYDTLIGYRRDQITQDFGNVKLTLPGKYKYEYEKLENGGLNLWTDDSDPHCPVWQVGGYSCKEGKAVYFEKGFEEVCELHQFEAGEGQCRYGWKKREADEPAALIAQVVCGDQLTLITITFPDDCQREAAVELLHQIKAYSPKEEYRQQRTYSTSK